MIKTLSGPADWEVDMAHLWNRVYDLQADIKALKSRRPTRCEWCDELSQDVSYRTDPYAAAYWMCDDCYTEAEDDAR